MKYHELPGDNVSIRMVDEIPYSLFVILGKHGLDTVGQVRRTSNEELLQKVGLTQKQLRTLRMWCPIDDVTAKANSPEMPATAMTLRDFFAAMAIGAAHENHAYGRRQDREHGVYSMEDTIAAQLVAESAYVIADAMIAMRKESQE